MARTPIRLYGPALLGTSASTLYTAPGVSGVFTKAIIRQLYFDNTTGGACTVTFSVGADAASTRMVTTYTVPALAIFQVNVPDLAVEAGEIIQGYASAGATVTLTVIGALVSPGSGSDGGIISGVTFSAGTQSSFLGGVTFANGNGLTFGLSNGTITGSAAAAPASVNLSAGTTSQNLTNFVFSNSNGLAFGLNGSTVTGSYTTPSTAGLLSAVNVSAGTTSSNLSAFVFSNSNGLAFGLNGSTVTGSYTVPPVGSISAGTTSASLGQVVLSGSNGISFGMNGGTVTASYTVPSTAGLVSAVNLSAGTTSNNLTAVTFSNLNGVSFGLNASTVTASVGAGATATGNLGAVAAGTQTATSGTVVYANGNGISFGMSGSTQLTASYTVPSTAGLLSAVNLSAGTTSSNLSAFVFSNSNNVSFGLNGSTITASASAFTVSYLWPFQEAAPVAGQHGQGTLHIHQIPDILNFQYDRMVFDLSVVDTITSATSGVFSLTMGAGIYTANVSTLSLKASATTSTAFTISSTNSSLFNGLRILTMGWTTTMNASNYWLGIVSSTNSAGINSATISQMLNSAPAATFSGLFGVAQNNTNQLMPGLGYFSAATSGLPASIAFSNISGTASNVLREPMYRFVSGTV